MISTNIRNIAILGSTGSIGKQTLDIIKEYPKRFRAYVLTANRSTDLLIAQAREFKPAHVVIACEECYSTVKNALADLDINVHSGSNAIAEVVTLPEVDTVVTAMVGYSGLAPTISAIKAGKTIALANKETLVVAGELITELLKRHGAKMYPVDSEHGAFYQCLVGEEPSAVEKLILTASGGPFRLFAKEQLDDVTVGDALKHPNWNMGAKITIDSATMMNKGFEMIEARWLFGIEPQRIEIVVHPQSIVHSMVEFVDGSVKAQLGLPDMHLPIRYALGLPQRLKTDERKLTIADYANLTFEKPDFEKFPLLGTAYAAADASGVMPCAMNAANEIAVASFLHRQIKFTDIHRIIELTMQHTPQVSRPQYDDFVQCNYDARSFAQKLIDDKFKL